MRVSSSLRTSRMIGARSFFIHLRIITLIFEHTFRSRAGIAPDNIFRVHGR